ncbi:hypothetical protein [Lignipirellula cremea]|uniref:DUF1257 domain-containing protein n=1 Tax=Lignipirellula cremea TaxID=2528010 RepID=A0A518DTK0_9BACT|nr:hypothetical protein [Lignipirellula cremea]QDU95170.1 hypothetical protein Pla8534_29820 [Lignipirellula cremea]
MSHTTTVACEFNDEQAIVDACKRLGLPAPTKGVHKLFDENTATGLGVKLEGWVFPVVIDTAKGEAYYDNYGGSWGKPVHFDRFKQAYAVERAKRQARKQGLRVREKVQQDGSIQLICQ